MQPHQYSAKSLTEVKVLRVNREILNSISVSENSENYNFGEGIEVNEIDAESSVDWMTQILRSNIFSKIPANNIQKIFSLFEPINVKAGETIVRQGDLGSHFYIIKSGRCLVCRKPSSNTKNIKMAELGEGASFGEESLIGNSPRNATVNMLVDGVIMQLKKEDFVTLIKEPVVNNISFQEAQDMIRQGAVWLDVRSPDKYNEFFLDGSINLPLDILRIGARHLDKNKHYIIYCDNGITSSTATFLLTQFGCKVSCLMDGLTAHKNLIPEKQSRLSIEMQTQALSRH